MAAAPRGWAPCATAGVLIAIGLACVAAGGYLVSLGGSWYYLLAGLAFAASGVRLWRRSVLALWIYAALVVATLARGQSA